MPGTCWKGQCSQKVMGSTAGQEIQKSGSDGYSLLDQGFPRSSSRVTCSLPLLSTVSHTERHTEMWGDAVLTNDTLLPLAIRTIILEEMVWPFTCRAFCSLQKTSICSVSFNLCNHPWRKTLFLSVYQWRLAKGAKREGSGATMTGLVSWFTTQLWRVT